VVFSSNFSKSLIRKCYPPKSAASGSLTSDHPTIYYSHVLHDNHLAVVLVGLEAHVMFAMLELIVLKGHQQNQQSQPF
jgi:hypothetical protein